MEIAIKNLAMITKIKQSFITVGGYQIQDLKVLR